MIKVVNKRVYKGEGVYIGRPGILGNEFRVEVWGREKCIKLYLGWLRREWKINGVVKQELLRLVELSQKGDLVLICWCAPMSCHGDVLKKVIEKLARTP